jgi:glycerol-3-phosphate dehydrogenase (NAD(P)+)
MKISIVGNGAFGSAMGTVLEKKGHTIFLKDHIDECDIVLVATPSYVVRETLSPYKDIIQKQKIIICSKGFDNDGNLLSIGLQNDFPNNKIYFLYGPTIADELKSEVLSVMVLAGGEDRDELKKEIESEYLIIKTTDDIIGVQVGSALKNTVGIFIGLVEGACVGKNTEAIIYTKGLEEIRKIGVSLGAKSETFFQYTCAGDMFLKSRSRILGCEIGKGRTFYVVDKELTYPKEGISSLKGLLKREKYIMIDLSFFKLIHQVIFEGMTVKDAILQLSKII